MLHSKLITRNDIDIIFQTLADNYEKLGGSKIVNIYLVGGAAIVLGFNYRMSTIDIDAYFTDNETLMQAIEVTGKEKGLANHWLNYDFINTPSYSKNIIEKSKMHSQFGRYINVFKLETKYLIAMKLKSSRPTGGDLDDIIKMIYETRLNKINLTYDDVIKAYEELYTNFDNTYDYFFKKTKEAFETPLEDIELIFNPH